MAQHYLHTHDPHLLGNLFLGLSNPALGGLPATPTIVETVLNVMTVNIPFAQTLAVSNGTGLKTWALTAGVMPTGIAFTAAGEVSGTPTVADQVYDFTVTVTDASNRTDSQQFTGTVSGGAG